MYEIILVSIIKIFITKRKLHYALQEDKNSIHTYMYNEGIVITFWLQHIHVCFNVVFFLYFAIYS